MTVQNKVLQAALLGCFVLGIISTFFVDYQEATYSPRAPVPSTGQIYLTHDGHNVKVYVTKEELYLTTFELPALCLGAFICCFVMAIVAKRKGSGLGVNYSNHKSAKNKLFTIILPASLLALAGVVVSHEGFSEFGIHTFLELSIVPFVWAIVVVALRNKTIAAKNAERPAISHDSENRTPLD